MSSGPHKPFVDPRPRLEADFEQARAELRRGRGQATTVRARLELAMDEWRLHREMVTKPLHAARW